LTIPRGDYLVVRVGYREWRAATGEWRLTGEEVEALYSSPSASRQSCRPIRARVWHRRQPLIGRCRRSSLCRYSLP